MENTTELEALEVRDDLDKESEQDGKETSSSLVDKTPIEVETVERKSERPLEASKPSLYNIIAE